MNQALENEIQKPVTVTIFDKEYTVGCAEDERDSLYSAVDYLNARMAELRDGGKVLGAERIAVIAALNIAHDYLNYRTENDSKVSVMDESLTRIDRKLKDALSRGREIITSDAA